MVTCINRNSSVYGNFRMSLVMVFPSMHWVLWLKKRIKELKKGRYLQETLNKNLRAKWAGQMPLISPFYRNFFFCLQRTWIWDMKPQFQGVSYTFQAHFSLLEAEFWGSHTLIWYLLPQIFSHFLPNCGSRNIGNKDERHGGMEWANHVAA